MPRLETESSTLELLQRLVEVTPTWGCQITVRLARFPEERRGNLYDWGELHLTNVGLVERTGFVASDCMSDRSQVHPAQLVKPTQELIRKYKLTPDLLRQHLRDLGRQ